jgi:hypothetical protein
MLTYQVRQRVFRFIGDKEPRFPAQVEIVFHYWPLQPFGLEAGGGLTTVQNQPASVFFNANTGQHYVESKAPLKPLEVLIEEPLRAISLTGTQLKVSQHFHALDELREFADSLYFGMPLLLGVQFADPPVVERVDGRIGDVEFRWELSDWMVEVDITTQDKQEERFATAWRRLDVLARPERRRLLGALYYFHVACRLRREGKSPGEFLAEAILNLSKVLEVLYGPSRADVRSALRQLGFADDEIERDFIPAMLLRNSMDVGHPSLALFTLQQLETLHWYADRAERVFRTFLQRLLEAVESEHAGIPAYEVGPVDADTQRTIETIRSRRAAMGDQP